jgi:RNA polymerase sigma factor (sigma-70 family)
MAFLNDEVIAQSFLRRALPYIDSPDFHAPGDKGEFLDPMPGIDIYDEERRSLRVPEGTPPELVGTYLYPTLKADQEHHLFRKMNYLKFLYGRLLDELRRRRYDRLPEAQPLWSGAVEAHKLLVGSNLRLLLAVAKTFACGRSLWEVVSDGNPVLCNAVSKFDYMRGFKFSTYAVWSLRKHYWRQKSEKARGVFQENDDLSDLEDEAVLPESETPVESSPLELILSYLEPRERFILKLRYPGQGGKVKTLEEVGQALSLTKERTRQIEILAVRKATVIARNIGVTL